MFAYRNTCSLFSALVLYNYIQGILTLPYVLLLLGLIENVFQVSVLISRCQQLELFKGLKVYVLYL